MELHKTMKYNIDRRKLLEVTVNIIKSNTMNG